MKFLFCQVENAETIAHNCKMITLTRMKSDSNKTLINFMVRFFVSFLAYNAPVKEQNYNNFRQLSGLLVVRWLHV